MGFATNINGLHCHRNSPNDGIWQIVEMPFAPTLRACSLYFGLRSTSLLIISFDRSNTSLILRM